MRTTDEYLLDIKCMLNGRKRIGWSALLPNQSPVGFAEISIRDYANGCRAQPVPFLEGIWVIKPYRRQGVVFALVKTIKRDPRLRTHNQNRTVAARAIADMKTFGHLS